MPKKIPKSKTSLVSKLYFTGNGKMSSVSSFEELSTSIATLNKSEVKRRLKGFKGVKLDFTERYLERQSTDKLRHILLAAMTTKRRHN